MRDRIRPLHLNFFTFKIMPEQKSDLQREFDRGLESARDEKAFAELELGQTVTTSLTSSWIFQTCPACGHTFRLGDQVRRVEGRGILHVSRPLDEFFAGLDETWPPPKDVCITRLLPGNLILSPRTAGTRWRTCQVCRHTLRPYDCVVVCPCRPASPICQAAVHQDPVNQLTCYKIWKPSGATLKCPVFSLADFSTEPNPE